ADRGHLHLDVALRPFGRGFVRMRAVTPLACIGDGLQFGEAIADFGHWAFSKRLVRHLCATSSPDERQRNPGSAPRMSLRSCGLRNSTHHSCFDASRAPSESEASFIHTILESTCSRPAKVPKPQSTPAMTFSRPTTLAKFAMRSATSSGC